MDNRSNKYISDALKIADDLMGLANDEAALADESGCGILFAVCRDCAYKIRHQAEQERRKASHLVHANAIVAIIAVAALSMVLTSPANATTIIMSTSATETFHGLTFGRGDLVEYDRETDMVTLFFDGATLFGSASKNIDAFYLSDNGNIILSTSNGATLGGLSFGKGDLIEYNPTTETATLFFDEELFARKENIDSVYILDSGNIVLSTVGNASLGGLSFTGDDLIEYNPITDTATMFLDGSAFDWSTDIDAVHLLENGNIILSTGTYVPLGGLNILPGDVVEYNPITDTASIYFPQSRFASGASIDAIHITSLPEPATIALLGLGTLVFILSKRR